MPAENVHTKGDLSKFGDEPVYFAETDCPVLRGQEGKSIEEKARILTDHWMNGLTQDTLTAMPATAIEKVAKIAGLGQAKRPEPTSNPIIAAILLMVKEKGLTLPEINLPIIDQNGEVVE